MNSNKNITTPEKPKHIGKGPYGDVYEIESDTVKKVMKYDDNNLV